MSTNCTVTKRGENKSSNFRRQFAEDVLFGLSQPVKSLPSKYIYDEKGSELFCRIMELPEYYPTRCELEVIDTHKETIVSLIQSENCNLVELGAGDGKKTRILIEHFQDMDLQFRYYPVDISENAVMELSSNFGEHFSDLEIYGLITDYFDGLRWLSSQNHSRNVVLFLGSSIGNFKPAERGFFLKSLRDALNEGDFVLIGFDLKKDVDMIVRAYNDTDGVTEQFNMNVLERINRELGGTFALNKFQYYSTWDALQGAIKSCLLSTCDQSVEVQELNRSFDFKAWEPIHTESSYKFCADELSTLAEQNGFEVIKNFSDEKQYFVDSLWRVRKDENY